DGRGEQRLASADRADGAGQLLAGSVLEQEAAGSGFHSVVDVLVEVEGGQHEDLGPAAALGELGGCLDPVESGHADVHQDDVGGQGACLCQCLAAVARLAGDAQIWLGFQQHPQALPDQVLVVGDQDADHDGSPTGSRAQTVNPPPGRGPARRSPPNTATRSRMPASPWPPPGGGGAELPRPSAVTSIVTALSAQPTVTSARAGPACLSTLVSASWTMR